MIDYDNQIRDLSSKLLHIQKSLNSLSSLSMDTCNELLVEVSEAVGQISILNLSAFYEKLKLKGLSFKNERETVEDFEKTLYNLLLAYREISQNLRFIGGRT